MYKRKKQTNKKKNKKTEDIDPTYVRSQNNRLMLKAKSGSCGIIKTQFVKENKAGKFDIHKAMLPLLPKTIKKKKKKKKKKRINTSRT